MAAIVEVIAGACTVRYFVSYTGVGLPFRLIGPIDDAQVANRNIVVRAWFDVGDRLLGFDKLVCREVELWHRYAYDHHGTLTGARISMSGEAPVDITLTEI